MAQTIAFATVSFRERLASFWEGIAKGTEAYMQSRSRMDVYTALQNKTDDELAEMGIKRDDIVRHVFGDLFYL